MTAASFDVWQKVTRYTVHVLAEEQEELSNRFARAKGEKWTGLTPLACASGAPLLPNALVVFDCEAYGHHDGGDNEILVERVVALHENPARHAPPLVFWEGRYRELSRADAAHAPPGERFFYTGGN